MPWTQAQLETELVGRCGRLMTWVGLDGTTVDGTNASLVGPINEGLRHLGIFYADTGSLALIATDSDAIMVLDIAELRTLLNILGNWDEFDEQGGDLRQAKGDRAEILRKTIADMRKNLKDLYGYGIGTLGIGVVNLDFAESDEPVADIY